MRNWHNWAFGSLVALALPLAHAAVPAVQGTTSLSGSLTAAGSPLSDCAVTLYRRDATQTLLVETLVTRTAADGKYNVNALAPADYIMVATCGTLRVYQGLVTVVSGPNDKSITLDDPLSGNWQLDVAKSNLGTFSAVRSELRTYSRTGSTTTMGYDQVDTAGRRVRNSYTFGCDGAEYRIPGGQQITCRFVGATQVEGHQGPPLSYYVRKVEGDVMTMVTYSDAGRKQLTSTQLFRRQP